MVHDGACHAYIHGMVTVIEHSMSNRSLSVTACDAGKRDDRLSTNRSPLLDIPSISIESHCAGDLDVLVFA